MEYAEFGTLAEGLRLMDIEVEIGRLQGFAQEHRERMTRFEMLHAQDMGELRGMLTNQNTILNDLSEQQRIAAAVRHEVEERQERRAKKIAGWASIWASALVAILVETLRYVVAHAGVR